MPVDSHFGQLPIELQERIIEIVVRCGTVSKAPLQLPALRNLQHHAMLA